MKPANPFILYVITDLELGGVPLHLQRLAIAMRGRGWRVAVASLAPPGPVGQALGDAGIPVYSCRGRGGRDVRVIGRLARIIEEAGPDLIHSFLFHANLAARFAAFFKGFPRDRLLCEIQTVEVERRWHLRVDRLTHRLCRYTIGNSPSVIDHLHREARIPMSRLRLIRGGIDINRILSAPRFDQRGLSAAAGSTPPDSAGNERSVRQVANELAEIKGPIVLWVGRLDPVKGLDILIRAFAQVTRETGAHLILVGGGALREDLDSLITQLELGTRAQLLGPRSDVPSLLKMADVFAFPSRTEGLPNALLEAMAAGCPIVTTDVPGCRDLVRPGETGLIVPFGDTSALARALRQLLQDRSTAMKLGKGAAEAVRAHWDVNVTIDEYEGSYREALGLLHS